MKKYILTMGLIICSLTILAQKETYDLISYTPPAGWKKEVKQNTYTSFTSTNNQKNLYCQIFIMLSTNSKGGIDEDFNNEWQTLVVKNYGVTQAPKMTETSSENGWDVKAGTAPFTFNNGQSIAIMTTMSGYNKALSIVAITNSQDYMPAIQTFLESVDMTKQSNIKQINNSNVKTPVKSKFNFTTTNFDDGWISTEQADWVEVTKGNLKVHIHYPNKAADAYNSVLLEGLKNAWNILVAPNYSSASNFEFKPTGGWESIEFAEADMTEKATGKEVHVILFKKNYNNGGGKYVEFISPDKRSFEQEFGAYHQSSSGWDKMEKMAGYNKFAVAASDLTGKWTSDFSGTTQYVNANTGLDAGMDTHSSNENFQFGPGNTYKWDLAVASGPVGNIKFQSVKSNGTFNMLGNWQINFSDIEGKPRNYSVYFSCIKGLRILWIDGTAYAKAE
jgi:hypothetical protein